MIPMQFELLYYWFVFNPPGYIFTAQHLSAISLAYQGSDALQALRFVRRWIKE